MAKGLRRTEEFFSGSDPTKTEQVFDEIAAAESASGADVYKLRNANQDFARALIASDENMRAAELARQADIQEERGNLQNAEILRNAAFSRQSTAAEYAPPIQSVADVDSVGDAIDYAQAGLGQLLPSMAAPLAGGIAGAAAGSVIPGLGTAGGFIGGALGGFVPGRKMMAEEAASRQLGDPTVMANTTASERLAQQNFVGNVGGALESIVPAAIGGRIFGAVRKKAVSEAIENMVSPVSSRGAARLTGSTQPRLTGGPARLPGPNQGTPRLAGETVPRLPGPPGSVVAREAGEAGARGRLFPGFGRETLGESLTELSQAAVGQYSHSQLNPERDRSHDTIELIDSAILGALGGGAVSTAVSAPGAAFKGLKSGGRKLKERTKKEFVELDDLKSDDPLVQEFEGVEAEGLGSVSLDDFLDGDPADFEPNQTRTFASAVGERLGRALNRKNKGKKQSRSFDEAFELALENRTVDILKNSMTDEALQSNIDLTKLARRIYDAALLDNIDPNDLDVIGAIRYARPLFKDPQAMVDAFEQLTGSPSPALQAMLDFDGQFGLAERDLGDQQSLLNRYARIKGFTPEKTRAIARLIDTASVVEGGARRIRPQLNKMFGKLRADELIKLYDSEMYLNGRPQEQTDAREFEQQDFNNQEERNLDDVVEVDNTKEPKITNVYTGENTRRIKRTSAARTNIFDVKTPFTSVKDAEAELRKRVRSKEITQAEADAIGQDGIKRLGDLWAEEQLSPSELREAFIEHVRGFALLKSPGTAAFKDLVKKELRENRPGRIGAILNAMNQTQMTPAQAKSRNEIAEMLDALRTFDVMMREGSPQEATRYLQQFTNSTGAVGMIRPENLETQNKITEEVLSDSRAGIDLSGPERTAKRRSKQLRIKLNGKSWTVDLNSLNATVASRLETPFGDKTGGLKAALSELDARGARFEVLTDESIKAGKKDPQAKQEWRELTLTDGAIRLLSKRALSEKHIPLKAAKLETTREKLQARKKLAGQRPKARWPAQVQKAFRNEVNGQIWTLNEKNGETFLEVEGKPVKMNPSIMAVLNGRESKKAKLTPVFDRNEFNQQAEQHEARIRKLDKALSKDFTTAFKKQKPSKDTKKVTSPMTATEIVNAFWNAAEGKGMELGGMYAFMEDSYAHFADQLAKQQAALSARIDVKKRKDQDILAKELRQLELFRIEVNKAQQEIEQELFNRLISDFKQTELQGERDTGDRSQTSNTFMMPVSDGQAQTRIDKIVNEQEIQRSEFEKANFVSGDGFSVVSGKAEGIRLKTNDRIQSSKRWQDIYDRVPAILAADASLSYNQALETAIDQHMGDVDARLRAPKKPTTKNPGPDRLRNGKPRVKEVSGLESLATHTKNGEIHVRRGVTLGDFLNYFTGAEGAVSSQQKKVVLQRLAKQGYPLKEIRKVVHNEATVREFLIRHELDHIHHNDQSVYWKNGKNLLTNDKIDIEVRATLAALKAMGIEQQVETLKAAKEPEVQVNKAQPKKQSALTKEEQELTAKLEEAGVFEPIMRKNCFNLCIGTADEIQVRLTKIFSEKDVARAHMVGYVKDAKGRIRFSEKSKSPQVVDHAAAAVRYKGRWYLVDQPQTEFSHAANRQSEALTMDKPLTPRVIPMRDVPNLYGNQGPVGFTPYGGGRGFGLSTKQILENWKTWIPAIYKKHATSYLSRLNTQQSPITGDTVHGFIQRLEQKLLDNGITKEEIASIIPENPREALINEANAKQSQYTRRSTRSNPQTIRQMKAEVEAELAKILGDNIEVIWKDTIAELGAAGDYRFNETQGKHVIRLAVEAYNPTSIAFHEAFHGFVTSLSSSAAGKELYNRLKTFSQMPSVNNQLNRLLRNWPAARRQAANSTEERLAYMFQFYATGELKLAPKPKNFFTKMWRSLMNTMGVMSRLEQGEFILNELRQGNVKSNEQILALHDYMARRDVFGERVRALGNFTANVPRKYLESPIMRLKGYNNTVASLVADRYYRFAGNEEGGLGQLQRRQQRQSEFMNRYADIVAGLNERRLQEMHRNLQAMKDASPGSPEAKVRELLDELYDYMLEAGVKVQVPVWDDRISDYRWEWQTPSEQEKYYPRVWDAKAILENEAEFRRIIQMHSQGEVIMRPDGTSSPITNEYLDAFIKALQDGDNMRDMQNLSYHNPASRSINPRQFTFINENNAADFAQFQVNDPLETFSTYVFQNVQRAEHSRDFGYDSGMLQQAVERLEQELTREQFADAMAAIQALEGTLGSNKITQKRKNLYVGIMSVLNMSMLPLALFSSFVDPLGIWVRSGDPKQALNGFKRGFQEIWNDLPGTKRSTESAEALKMAKYIGAIEDSLALELVGHYYNGAFMNPTLKEWNERFFRWIGLDAWTRGTRIAATETGISYIIEHQNDAARMKELGLRQGDIEVIGDNEIRMNGPGVSPARERRIKEALFKFVDGGVLRPNSAQRPVWMSDPRFLLFGHLKQFTFSYHHTILKRVGQRLKQAIADEQITPATAMQLGAILAPMAAYVGVMMAADMTRSIVGGRWDDEDEDLGDRFKNGVQRSTILGIGTLALDAKTDMNYSGLPLNTAMGPAASRAFALGSASLSGDPGEVTYELTKLLPGYALWKGYTR